MGVEKRKPKFHFVLNVKIKKKKNEWGADKKLPMNSRDPMNP